MTESNAGPMCRRKESHSQTGNQRLDLLLQQVVLYELRCPMRDTLVPSKIIVLNDLRKSH